MSTKTETIEIPELFGMSYDDIDALPTIEEGWTADLKIHEWRFGVDGGPGFGYKVWIERTTQADGDRYNHALVIELTNRGRWYTAAIIDPASYEARNLSSLLETEADPYEKDNNR